MTEQRQTPGRSPVGADEAALRLVAEMGSRLPSCAEPEDLQRAILEGAAAILGCDCGAIALWDESEESLRPGAVLGEGRLLQTLDFFASRPVTSRVLGHWEAIRLTEPSGQVNLPAGKLSALLAVPMVTGERLAGVLVLGSTEKGRAFGASEELLVQVVANFSASVLDSTVQFGRFSYDLRARIVEATKELNRALAELDQVKSFNENIFESISMGILVFDRSFGVIFRNRLAEETFPEDRNVLRGLGRTNIASRYEGYEEIFRGVVRLGQICGFEGVGYERPGGAAKVLRLTSSPLLGKRQAIVGGILTVEDVTRNVVMENRLAASERLAAVGKLAAKVAHELNNPLDGILRYVSLAARVCREGGDERPVAYLESARGGLMRMARIIGELLEFSRSTADVTEDGSIRTALEEAIKSLSGKADQQGVSLEVTIGEDVPPMESSSLCQVFTNLIKNAIEAMPGGGKVTVAARAASGAVEVRVSDTGPGIAADKLGSIFEPFFSTKGAGQGTGLGLAISKEIVEKQGGTIEARNRAEGGAEFVVRIPTQWVRKDVGRA